nr:integrase, catalytic region, zinc finger, CCHC-type, peptidase aspartic, catalytic [Tanacetum cinerariifolium]
MTTLVLSWLMVIMWLVKASSPGKHSCYVRDTNGVDLIKGSRESNLYTISVEDMMKSSPICLLSKASKKKSWLWHRRLNRLNFGTINDLARESLVHFAILQTTAKILESFNATADTGIFVGYAPSRKGLPPGVIVEPHFMEDHNVAPVDNNPFVNVFALEPHSEASSSGDISSTESPNISQTLHHLKK